MLKSFMLFKPNDQMFNFLNAIRSPEVLGADELEDFELVSPTASEWSSIGLCKFAGAEYVLPTIGGKLGSLMMVGIAERVLPGPVIRNAVKVKVKELELKEQRKLGKKDIAQVKEDILPALLGKSHIKVNHVPVILGAEYCVVGSASVRVVDQVSSFLRSLMINAADGEYSEGAMYPLPFPKLNSTLQSILKDTDQFDQFDLGAKLNLLGQDGDVKFSNAELGSTSVTQHLVGQWGVNMMQVVFGNTVDNRFEPRIKVDVLPAGIFRGFKPYGVLTQQIRDDVGQGDDDAINEITVTASLLYTEICGFANALLAADNSQDEEL